MMPQSASSSNDGFSNLNAAADAALALAWKTTKSAAGHAEAWAAGNPYKAAAAGAVIGVVSSVAFNKLLAIKGTVAIASCVYGAGKGAAMGYAYPATRKHAASAFRSAAAGVKQATTAAQRAAERAQSQARAAWEKGAGYSPI